MRVKKPNYKARATALRATGIGITSVFTLGGFIGYEALTNFEHFSQQSFTEISDGQILVSPYFAIPLVIGIIISLFVVLRKNKEYFKDKATLGLFIATIFTFAFFSIAGMLLFTLVGATAGSLIDETIFLPLAKKELVKADDQHIIDRAYKEEKLRAKARQEFEKENELGNV